MKILTLGEIMLRLSSPTGQRLLQTSSMSCHYGGGEANVAISLANFGHDAYFASLVPDNLLGLGVKQHLEYYGVHTDYLLFGGERLGTYYLETGVSQRGSQVIYDRAHSSFSQISNDIWQDATLFTGIDLFHISGITPALSEEWQVLTKQLIQKARLAGCKISLDINYRGKLWTQAAAGLVIRELLPLVDYCSAGELDARYILALFEDKAISVDLLTCYQKMAATYPNLAVIYSTKRQVRSASENDLQGFIYRDGHLSMSQAYHISPIIDRVGSGDAFSAGILHGILKGWDAQEIIAFGTAACVLKHTVEGDRNLFTEREVLRFQRQESGEIKR
ncbi:sugar kinase [Lactococcus piscium]|uniref:sugar kinase n=1 Tax=Pseudolactococcus carnosus TaxID=2749961 RepID=UPI001FB8F25F|nr:sugar kinase [Lactococcus carnosus]MCJ1997151.1 sugar kinase [Lactococcus carnosus]